jgi:hypothetical protein
VIDQERGPGQPILAIGGPAAQEGGVAPEAGGGEQPLLPVGPRRHVEIAGDDERAGDVGAQRRQPCHMVRLLLGSERQGEMHAHDPEPAELRIVELHPKRLRAVLGPVLMPGRHPWALGEDGGGAVVGHAAHMDVGIAPAELGAEHIGLASAGLLQHHDVGVLLAHQAHHDLGIVERHVEGDELDVARPGVGQRLAPHRPRRRLGRPQQRQRQQHGIYARQRRADPRQAPRAQHQGSGEQRRRCRQDRRPEIVDDICGGIDRRRQPR